MSLIQYVQPLLELGICKEYMMARKTTGTTTTRSKKKSVSPVIAESSPEIVNEEKIASQVTAREIPGNGSSNGNGHGNVEEEIRRRAYELYLQRRATAGSENGHGDENQDWFVAEREILSRHDGQEQQRA
jgi:Protein of unknown function (DUF2934)